MGEAGGEEGERAMTTVKVEVEGDEEGVEVRDGLKDS